MSSETATGSVSPVARAADLVGRTRAAVGSAWSSRGGRAVFGASVVTYLLAYQVGLGHLARGSGSVSLTVVADPLARALQQRAPFQFEPVALVALGPVEWLVSPVNLALGLGLALLVGANLAVSWVAWRSPAQCRVGPGAGAAAGVPALLSGFVCCGPTILLVVGLQASAGLLVAFRWLVPASATLLVLTLLWVGSQVEPA